MAKKLNELTISEARAGLLGKQFSARELAQACLDHINKHNSKLNAYLHLNDQILSQADSADLSLPLGGIPFAVKDNYLTVGQPTTASSNVLKNYYPPYNATVIQKLTAAGMLILGKTNMDAWAHGSSTETSDFGPTLNPWNTGHLPGGSSGGSAAAVAANMCIAALGTETAGSIRQPASWCGITGFKPTYGRASRYGLVAMASSTDQPGPLVKNAEDAALVMEIISGRDPYDATTSPLPVDKYTTAPKSVRGLKIGLPKEYLLPQMRPEVKALIKEAAAQFEKLGAVVEETSLIDPKYSIGVYTILQRSEVSSNLARYDGIRYGQDRSAFGEEAKRRIMLGTYALSSGYYDQYYAKAQKVRTLIINDFNACFKKYDLIIGPTSPGPALPVGASKNHPMFGEMEDILAEPSSIAGLCSISVPCGFVDGLPIGLQITGPQFGELSVTSAAFAYQGATSWHTQFPQL